MAAVTSRRQSNSTITKQPNFESTRYERRMKATNFLLELEIANSNRLPCMREFDQLNHLYSN